MAESSSVGVMPALVQQQTPERSILVVEDDDSLREILVDLLQSRYWLVSWAKDGRDGFETFRAEPADIVLTDMVMPVMSGIDLIRRIREYDLETPLVILTGYGSLDFCAQALRAGANDFVEKPFQNDALADCLVKLWQDSRRTSGPLALDAFLHQSLTLVLPSAELCARTSDIVAQAYAVIATAGMHRRSLSVRRAVESALAKVSLAMATEKVARADEILFEIKIDARAAVVSIKAPVPCFTTGTRQTMIGDTDPLLDDRGRLAFLIQSYSDEVHVGEGGREILMTFFRPRTHRPLVGGA